MNFYKLITSIYTIVFFNSCFAQTEIENIENGLLPTISNNIKNTNNILNRMNYYHIPNVSICVFKEGKINWKKNYSIKNQAPCIYQAGSISKTITAFAVLKLVNNGVLNLNEDIRIYLDSTIHINQNITLRQLLSHTAGVNIHGFEGYNQQDSLPTLYQIITGRGNNDSIQINEKK